MVWWFIYCNAWFWTPIWGTSECPKTQGSNSGSNSRSLARNVSRCSLSPPRCSRPPAPVSCCQSVVCTSGLARLVSSCYSVPAPMQCFRASASRPPLRVMQGRIVSVSASARQRQGRSTTGVCSCTCQWQDKAVHGEVYARGAVQHSTRTYCTTHSTALHDTTQYPACTYRPAQSSTVPSRSVQYSAVYRQHRTVQYNSIVQYSTVQYSACTSTVQYSTVQYSTSTVQHIVVQLTAQLSPQPCTAQHRQCSTVQCSAMQYSTVRCSTVQYITVQCSAVQRSAQYGTAQHHTAQHSTTRPSTQHALCSSASPVQYSS